MNDDEETLYVHSLLSYLALNISEGERLKISKSGEHEF
jgi:phosphotransferase system HPr-like phosphotransfer protein